MKSRFSRTKYNSSSSSCRAAVADDGDDDEEEDEDDEDDDDEEEEDEALDEAGESVHSFALDKNASTFISCWL